MKLRKIKPSSIFQKKSSRRKFSWKNCSLCKYPKTLSFQDENNSNQDGRTQPEVSCLANSSVQDVGFPCPGVPDHGEELLGSACQALEWNRLLLSHASQSQALESNRLSSEPEVSCVVNSLVQEVGFACPGMPDHGEELVSYQALESSSLSLSQASQTLESNRLSFEPEESCFWNSLVHEVGSACPGAPDHGKELLSNACQDLELNKVLLSQASQALESNRLLFKPEESSSILTAFRFPFKECMVLAMESDDPYMDFTSSMEQMIKGYGLKAGGVMDWGSVEELLTWYLMMNNRKNHDFIVAAFVDLCMNLSAFTSSCDLCNL